MSRGLGDLQRTIKNIIAGAFRHGLSAVRFPDIRAVVIAGEGPLSATHERSLKRALKGLVDRGEVVIVSGTGRPGDPYRYITVECFASATGQTVRDTAHAKQIVAEMAEKAREIEAAE